jgi:hypothetical protein
MCKSIKYFKLCTCGEMKRKPSNYWVLYRGEKEVMNSVMGSIVEPDFESPKMLALQEQIVLTEKLLNATQLFDFEYQPKSGDKLALHMRRFEYEFWFQYKDDKWKEEGSIIPFDHPKHTFKKYRTGKVKVDKFQP